MNDTFDAGPSKNGRWTVSVNSTSTYYVAMRKDKSDFLYRYELPIWPLGFVDQIKFSLSKEVQNKGFFLHPASVRCAFALTNDPERYNHVRQSLRWSDRDPEWGTSFLPGHGVTFTWYQDVAARLTQTLETS